MWKTIICLPERITSNHKRSVQLKGLYPSNLKPPAPPLPHKQQQTPKSSQHLQTETPTVSILNVMSVRCAWGHSLLDGGVTACVSLPESCKVWSHVKDAGSKEAGTAPGGAKHILDAGQHLHPPWIQTGDGTERQRLFQCPSSAAMR